MKLLVQRPHPAKIGALCLLALLALGRTYGQTPAVEAEDITDAILGPGPSDVSGFDVNQDGQVDVADIIFAANSLPLISFSNPLIIAREGQTVVNCDLEADRVFTGVLQYSVGGTAISGDDYSPITGNLLIDNSFGTISIVLADDIQVEATKTIVLTIQSSSVSPPVFGLGTSSAMIVVLEDDDSLWEGRLVRGDLELPFQLTIAQMGSQIVGTLASDGAGLFPAGTWPVDIQISSGEFAADIGPIAMPPSLSLLDESFSRSTSLLSQPIVNPGDVLDLSATIKGSLLDEFVFADPTSEHLTRVGESAIHGRFVLTRALPEIPRFVPELVPAP